MYWLGQTPGFPAEWIQTIKCRHPKAKEGEKKMCKPHLCPWGICRFERAQKMRQRCDCSLLIKQCQNSVCLCSPWPFQEREPLELNWVPICFQAAWPRVGGKSCLKSQHEATLTLENHQPVQINIQHERLMINHLIGGQNKIMLSLSHPNLKRHTSQKLSKKGSATFKAAFRNQSSFSLSHNNPTCKQHIST